MATTETISEAPDASTLARGGRVVPTGPGGWLVSSDHKTVGKLLLLLAVGFLVAGGVLALILRTQLSGPDLDVLDADRYGQLLTLHGLFTVFLFMMPAWAGLAFVIVPLQIGAVKLAFPRLAAQTLWLFLTAGVLIVVAAFVRHSGAPTTGWSLSPSLPRGDNAVGHAADLVMLGMAVAAVALLLAAVNLLATVLKLRAPGLTLRRTPLFSWAVVVSSSVVILATPALLAGLILLFVDRHYGGRAFDGNGGGDPLIWSDLFWFFAYPVLWALLLPTLGLVSEVVAVFARPRRERANTGGLHRAAMGALAAVGVLSMFGWGSEIVHHATVPKVLFAIAALAVLAPAAVLVLTWLGALAGGRPAMSSSLVGALGLLTVVGAGLVGRAVTAAAPTGKVGIGTQWAQGARHELFFAGAVLGLVVALHYWAPKLWGRRLGEPLGVLGLLLLVAGTHLSFVPMYVLGAQGMRQHVVSYPSSEGWQAANVVATIGGYVLVLGLVVFLLNLLVSVVLGRGAVVDDDPWEGHTLEWATSSPPPPHNFDTLPEIRSHRPLADLRVAVGAGTSNGEAG